MSELQIIHSALEGAAGRRRWVQALRGLWRGLLVGAVLSLLLAGAYHLLPLPVWTLLLAALIPIPCLLIGLVLGGWRTIPLPQVARWLDGRQHLQERLSTALEVSSEPTAGTWRDLVVADAAGLAKELDPRRPMPLNVPPQSNPRALPAPAPAPGPRFLSENRRKGLLPKTAHTG